MRYLYISTAAICIASSCSNSLDSSDMKKETKLIIEKGIENFSGKKISEQDINKNIDILITSLNKILTKKKDEDPNVSILHETLLMERKMLETAGNKYIYISVITSILKKFLGLEKPLTAEEKRTYFKALASISDEYDISNNEKCIIM